MSYRCHYSVVYKSSNLDILVLRDENRGVSITNDADNLVLDLYKNKMMESFTQLYYYDSEGQLDQILHQNGRFQGFSPGPGRTHGLL